MIPLNEFECAAVEYAQSYAAEENGYCREGDWTSHLAFFEEALVNELEERSNTEVCS